MVITCREELFNTIKADLKVNARKKLLYIGDEIGRYLYFLRCREYIDYKINSKSGFMPILKIKNIIYKYIMHRLGIKLQFDIPINVVDSGLSIAHWGFLAINGNAKVGKNCQIFGDVTIGQKSNTDPSSPIIGDNVIIGAGARIIGGGKNRI